MKEEEIRKREIFNSYLKLVKNDVDKFFDFKSFEQINCPACDNDSFTEEFEKFRFSL